MLLNDEDILSSWIHVVQKDADAPVHLLVLTVNLRANHRSSPA